MATDPRGHVRPGDKLRIAAEQINWINRQMAADTSFGGGPLAGIEPARNIVYMRNVTGQDVPRWGVMSVNLGNAAIIPEDPQFPDASRRSFEEVPCLEGSLPPDYRESVGDVSKLPFVIAIEPIKAGKIGRVAVAGVIQARVEATLEHAYFGWTYAVPNGSVETLSVLSHGPARIIWPKPVSPDTTSWALIRLGDEGPRMRVGKVEEDWAVGTSTALVKLYEGSGRGGVEIHSANDPTLYLDAAWNLSFDVKEGSWVLVEQAVNGNWYLVDAGMEGSCRQTIGGEDVTKWPGWNGSSNQLLGHDANGCLAWFDTSTCS
jgi:hypothetical protein